MNTIHSPQKGDPEEDDPTSKERIEESNLPFDHEVNITDGGEFIDDAIRMKDQPLEETSLKKSESFQRVVKATFFKP